MTIFSLSVDRQFEIFVPRRMSDEARPSWPHAPPHKLDGQGRYFVTSATLHHKHHFRSDDRLQLLHDSKEAKNYPWCSAAWFERTASAAMVKSIYRMKTDTIVASGECSPEWDGRE